jgi:hypothetical protein
MPLSIRSGWLICRRLYGFNGMVPVGRGESKALVAILIQQSSRWPLALRTGRALRQTGATVTLFYLGWESMAVDASILHESCNACYAGNCRMGMERLPLEEIALRLKQCDLVIPI